MDQDVALKLMSQMLITAAIIAAPILIANLLVGVVISIIQTVTQIQEMTLTFVPKLIVSVVVALLFGNWMLNTLQEFTRELFAYAAAMGVSG